MSDGLSVHFRGNQTKSRSILGHLEHHREPSVHLGALGQSQDPSVDLRGPSVNLRGPSVDLRGSSVICRPQGPVCRSQVGTLSTSGSPLSTSRVGALVNLRSPESTSKGASVDLRVALSGP